MARAGMLGAVRSGVSTATGSLAVWKSALFGKPERKEWILVRYTGHGTLGDETDPMTLHEALCRVAALTADDKKRRIGPASRSRG